MRFRIAPLAVVLGLLACAGSELLAPRAALPQEIPPPAVPTVPWVHISALGDTVVGRAGIILQIDTVTPRVVVTIDTLYCTAAGACSKTRLAPTDTIKVTLGIPFGPFGTSAAPFTLRVGSVSPANIVSQLEVARASKLKLLLAMTGGSHDNYMSTINGVYQFDLAKWKARMDGYNTPAIREAVAEAVSDGTIIGNYVMDEPQVDGGSNPDADGNTWGPTGTMTKARVDQMCAYVLQRFPTLPVGVAHTAEVFEPDKDYSVCQFILAQYANRKGDVARWRDAQLAYARRDRIQVVFSLNILGGGVPDRDGVYDCKGEGQGGLGVWKPLCTMTPAQLVEYGLTLGTAACGLTMWKYDSTYMAKPENQRAFRDIAAILAKEPARTCGPV